VVALTIASVFLIELVLKELLRTVTLFEIEELVGLRMCAAKRPGGRMQAVRQVLSAPGFEDRVWQFSPHRLPFSISGRTAWRAEKHYKSKPVLSGIAAAGKSGAWYSRLERSPCLGRRPKGMGGLSGGTIATTIIIGVLASDGGMRLGSSPAKFLL